MSKNREKVKEIKNQKLGEHGRDGDDGGREGKRSATVEKSGVTTACDGSR